MGCTSPVVLELILCLLPRVAPEHAGWFGEVRLVGVVKWGRGRKGIQVRFQGGLCAFSHECRMCISRLSIYWEMRGLLWDNMTLERSALACPLIATLRRRTSLTMTKTHHCVLLSPHVVVNDR